MVRPLSSIILIVVLAPLAACDSSSSDKTRASAPENPTRFQVRGVLRKLDPDHRHAVIAHEDIAGYMKAMTMEFELTDPREASALEPGDILAFRLSVTDTKSWIDQIQKIGHTPLPASAPETAPTVTPSLTSLPDVALINQRGQTFHLNDLRGRALAITFFFTRCPLPNFCPLMHRNFETVQRDLAASTPTDRWRLLSITIDPANDTPEVLAKYASNYQTNPEQWIFATGGETDIRQLGSVFGLEFAGFGGQINHNLRTVVVDRTGRIQRVFDGNDWQPAELAAEMRRAMSKSP